VLESSCTDIPCAVLLFPFLGPLKLRKVRVSGEGNRKFARRKRVQLLADSIIVFAKRCVRGIDVDREQLTTNVERSLLAVTALDPILGYDRVAQIMAAALRDRVTPRAAAISLGFLNGNEYGRLVDPAALFGGPTPSCDR